MNPAYVPKTLLQKLAYLAEEAGEVVSAVGKTIRWGTESSNPELPPEQRETNRDWILRELVDLERAIRFAREALFDAGQCLYSSDEKDELIAQLRDAEARHQAEIKELRARLQQQG